MKKYITLKLINNEKKNSRVLSTQACTIDNAVCAGGANDICQSLDYAGCYGTYTIDYCKYIDVASCSSGKYDYCYNDYALNCYLQSQTTDICPIDR